MRLAWNLPLALLALSLGACTAEADAAGADAGRADAAVVDRAEAPDTRTVATAGVADPQPDTGEPNVPSAGSDATLAATSAPPAKLEGLPYIEARRIVLGYGWTAHDGACGGGGTSPALCRSFPEIGNCSGVGQGFCDMSFDKPGRCLSIVTAGGQPGPTGSGDDHVERVRFRTEACD